MKRLVLVPLKYREPFPKKLAWDKATLTGVAMWARGTLTSTGFQQRLVWDKARFSAIQKWLDLHLPKVTDLGVVEVSASAPARISLAPGTDYLIRTEVLTQPGMTNDWYSLRLSLDSTMPNNRPGPGHTRV